MSRHRVPGGTGPRGGGGGVPAGPGRANELRSGAQAPDVTIDPPLTEGGPSAPMGYPKLIQPKRWCRNEQIPDSFFRRKVRDAQNHVMAYRSKTFASWGDMVNLVAAAPVGGNPTKDLWRMRCMTGHGAREMRFLLGIASVSDTAAADPQVIITVSRVTDGTAQGLSVTTSSTTTTLHAGSAASVLAGPSFIGWHEASVDVLPLTTYEVLITGYDCGAPQAGVIYEWCHPGVWALTDHYQTSPGLSGSPINDADREKAIRGLSEMWQYKGTHLLNWCGPHTAAGISLSTTANWKNVFDQAVVSAVNVDSSTPGWSFARAGGTTSTALPSLSALARFKDSGAVPCVFAVYGSALDADGARARLQDGSGTTLIETGNITQTAGWWTVNFDLTTATDLRFILSGTGVGAAGGLLIYAASVYTV